MTYHGMLRLGQGAVVRIGCHVGASLMMSYVRVLISTPTVARDSQCGRQCRSVSVSSYSDTCYFKLGMSEKSRLPTSAASFGRTGDHRRAGVLSLAYFSASHSCRCKLMRVLYFRNVRRVSRLGLLLLLESDTRVARIPRDKDGSSINDETYR